MGTSGRGGRAQVCTPVIARLLAVLVATWGMLAACTEVRPEARTHRVGIRAFQYLPAVDTVAIGDTVVWTNEDAVPHTATASDRAWDTGSIGSKQSGHFVVDDTGEHPYVCAFHPNMRGTLIVR